VAFWAQKAACEEVSCELLDDIAGGAERVEAMSKAAKSSAEADKQRFKDGFESILKELLQQERESGQLQHAIEHLERMYKHNVPHGKLNRGLAVLEGVRAIREPSLPGGQVLPEAEVSAAVVVGWCIELLQAFFLVEDDIMDGSYTRRGQRCWYRDSAVGMVAINDGIILESAIYSLLKSHLRSHPRYVDLIELFHSTTRITAGGQLIDLISTPPNSQVDFSRFDMDTYSSIVCNKTAHYTFYLPAACAMLLSNVRGDEAFERARDICLQMGQFFQVQDDVLDAYADPEELGKVGTDIQDNKITWLAVKALCYCSDNQRRIMDENYGREEDECVQAVKQVYRDLGLHDEFKKYEEQLYSELMQKIAQQEQVPKPLFTNMLDKIYKRSK
jgi:farnesyl diphosphate synthase